MRIESYVYIFHFLFHSPQKWYAPNAYVVNSNQKLWKMKLYMQGLSWQHDMIHLKEVSLSKLKCKQDHAPESTVQILFNSKCDIEKPKYEEKGGWEKRSEKERLSTKISPPHGSLQCPMGPSLPWSSGVGVPVF